MTLLKLMHDAQDPLPSPFAADGEIVLDKHDPFGTRSGPFEHPPKGFCEVEILVFVRVWMCVLVCVERDGCVLEALLGVHERGVCRRSHMGEDGERRRRGHVGEIRSDRL